MLPLLPLPAPLRWLPNDGGRLRVGPGEGGVEEVPELLPRRLEPKDGGRSSERPEGEAAEAEEGEGGVWWPSAEGGRDARRSGELWVEQARVVYCRSRSCGGAKGAHV